MHFHRTVDGRFFSSFVLVIRIISLICGIWLISRRSFSISWHWFLDWSSEKRFTQFPSRTKTIFLSVFFSSWSCRILFCLDLIAWFVGTLHLFSAFEKLGPKLVMIFNTVDWGFFSRLFVKHRLVLRPRWKIFSSSSVLFLFSSVVSRSRRGHWSLPVPKWIGCTMIMDTCSMWPWIPSPIKQDCGKCSEISLIMVFGKSLVKWILSVGFLLFSLRIGRTLWS